MRGHFGDLLTAIVTPFDSAGQLDVDGLQDLASWVVSSGSEGIVVAGSTGEAPTLEDGERIRAFEAAVEAVGKQAKVIGNVGTYSTAHTIELALLAERAGVDALLVVTPYYSRPPQRGLLAHFKAVAAAVQLPILLYDIPSRTARKIEHLTLIELSRVSNIVGVKDSSGDVAGASRLVAEVASDFHVYCGEDSLTVPMIGVGAVGCIAVASHIAGPQMAEMISAAKAGEAERARKIHAELLPLFEALAVSSNPIPIKAALRMLGRPAGNPRLPLVPASPEEEAVVASALRRLGMLP